jgi:arsenite methyltransferase
VVAILGYSRKQIANAVQDMYTAVADNPSSPFHFPVGNPALRVLGYPLEQLEELPPALLESFAGVGYPFRASVVRTGDTTLDIGAGAGNDSLIAGRYVGPGGRVIALDLTAAMTRKLRACLAEAGADNIEVVQGSAEALPLADESVDSITSNGALNLVPDKRRAVAEMFRVLRPGGRLQIADVVINRPVTVDCREDPRLWVECIVGATVEENLLALFRDAGFEDIEILGRQDYFSHSPSAQTREIAAGFGAHSIELAMRRGPRAPSRLQKWLRRCNPGRWLAAIRRQGLAGLASLALALLACYGTLAALGLLAVLGVSLVLNETLWAGVIAGFGLLTSGAVAAGYRRHRAIGPGLLAVGGTALVLYALFARYSFLTELLGFVVLASAVAWDLLGRRREESQILGLRTGD